MSTEKMPKIHTYVCIDLKSFYASCECVEKGLDPLRTNLVVADPSRTEKTICLAVTPSLKRFGIPGRARLFEVVQRVREVNAERLKKNGGKPFHGASHDAVELDSDPGLELSYVVAPPRMAHYMDYSAKIYRIYLQYVAPEDIFPYSVDEVFIDVTAYLSTYKCTAHQLTIRMIRDVLSRTGITATAGIGTNPYLAKIAMDIVAKHVDADADGVRIAELDEMSYRRKLWTHRPLTDFWRIGRATARKLESRGLYTMGDVARCSLENQDLLYRIFGVNAELLIDHAWGYEPTEMQDIKSYRSKDNSLSSGQVLSEPYPKDKARLVIHEMTDLLVLDLVEKRLMTNQMVLTVGYDVENLTNPEKAGQYKGEVKSDYYGRKVPKHAHGTANLSGYTSSGREIISEVLNLFDRIVDENLTVRRMVIAACHILPENEVPEPDPDEGRQLDLFADFTPEGKAEQERKEKEEEAKKKERNVQQAVLDIQKKYGKNAILKGMNLEEGATARDRNRQIGGHKA